MRVTETLIKQNNQKEEKKIRSSQQEYFMDMYKDKGKQQFFNQTKSVFDVEDTTSINTRKSVFDEQAVFKITDKR